MAEQGRYKKIVVPIDGSKWSERAIPHAIDIAQHNDAEIILVHVHKHPAGEFVDSIALGGAMDQLDQPYEEVKQHLQGMRGQIRAENVRCRVQLIEGAGPAHLICDYVNQEKPDLVIITTHGRSGLTRFLFGSVANKIVQGVNVPVLLIRPDREESDWAGGE